VNDFHATLHLQDAGTVPLGNFPDQGRAEQACFTHAQARHLKLRHARPAAGEITRLTITGQPTLMYTVTRRT